jgi:ElaB/YqjD/DUF883 family membrane-anchored ribosome-binding protein
MENVMPLSGSSMPPPGSSAASVAAEAASRAHKTLDDATVPVVNRMVNKAHATIDRVAQKATPAAERMHQWVESTSTRSTRLVGACSTTIRDRPITSIAAAAALGYLLGRLLR